MGSLFGDNLKISLFGESHGEAIGLVIDSLPSGLKINEEEIKLELAKRKPYGSISTTRIEEDKVEFLSGIFNGYTTGAPLAFIIKNKNVDSSKYVKGVVRPSHADLTANIKFNGYEDYRGGGHFSGRITAPLMVLGAICRDLLKMKGVEVATHIKELGECVDDAFDNSKINEQIRCLNHKQFPVINEDVSLKMIDTIDKVHREGDSIGGMLETIVIGMKPGIGEPFFNSIESRLSSLLFSIGGVKGVLFGDGIEFIKKTGSFLNDELQYVDGEINYLSNHNGGINGGISNGQPIIINTIVKPTPSISKMQHSINILERNNLDLRIEGRHDPCIVHRVRAVVDALVCYGLVDLIMANQARKW